MVLDAKKYSLPLFPDLFLQKILTKRNIYATMNNNNIIYRFIFLLSAILSQSHRHIEFGMTVFLCYSKEFTLLSFNNNACK